jgi:hypothetical protein
MQEPVLLCLAPGSKDQHLLKRATVHRAECPCKQLVKKGRKLQSKFVPYLFSAIKIQRYRVFAPQQDSISVLATAAFWILKQRLSLVTGEPIDEMNWSADHYLWAE